ncbi:MAG: helix-turn-helix domain-containing protein [Candidatus Contendobacter sp.]|jgi:predicted XRE-type DNA-binding protein|nr:XRE family transcriptional regulator [Gammaproteobacteria bacterium]MCC8993526.1 helix-turn-helix domain-containing protein [Candidatus Contendobacter sp.]
MTPEIEFENSCGNVFADLGLDHAEDLYMRAALGAQVVAMLKAQGYTPAEAAACLGIKPPEISALMCAKFHRFSQERLINFPNRLNLKVAIHISTHHQGEPLQQVCLVT